MQIPLWPRPALPARKTHAQVEALLAHNALGPPMHFQPAQVKVPHALQAPALVARVQRTYLRRWPVQLRGATRQARRSLEGVI
eukprot:5629287-Pyramimonas_sp.AAC.1